MPTKIKVIKNPPKCIYKTLKTLNIGDLFEAFEGRLCFLIESIGVDKRVYRFDTNEVLLLHESFIVDNVDIDNLQISGNIQIGKCLVRKTILEIEELVFYLIPIDGRLDEEHICMKLGDFTSYSFKDQCVFTHNRFVKIDQINNVTLEYNIH